jgi:hypothetical protein
MILYKVINILDTRNAASNFYCLDDNEYEYSLNGSQMI